MLIENKKNFNNLVTEWLLNFEEKLINPNQKELYKLFKNDSHWRDLLAFTWHIKTYSGAEIIENSLSIYSKKISPHSFKIDTTRTPPRYVTRAGKRVIEAFFIFQNLYGKCNGLLRLKPRKNGFPKAWTLMTSLAEIDQKNNRSGEKRFNGSSYAKKFSGPNWLDSRRISITYKDRQPTVLIVGGGQAGLSIAARLGQNNIDALIVDSEERIGDNWRNRYHHLSLHNQTHVNHLPYMSFPSNWPTYIPKDKLAGWFVSYAESMEINFWTKTKFKGGSYDQKSRTWSAIIKKANGKLKNIHPKHIIIATGVSGIPNLPKIPSLKNFVGEVIHSSNYQNGTNWKGKKALILGSGNSAHDIAQDLYSNGTKVTMVQRSPTTIVNVEPSAQLPYKLYEEGAPLEECDLITLGTPLALLKKTHQLITEQTKVLDKSLLDRLSNVGFKTDFGVENTGWQFKYLSRGGGY